MGETPEDASELRLLDYNSGEQPAKWIDFNFLACIACGIIQFPWLVITIAWALNREVLQPKSLVKDSGVCLLNLLFTLLAIYFGVVACWFNRKWKRGRVLESSKWNRKKLKLAVCLVVICISALIVILFVDDWFTQVWKDPHGTWGFI